MSEAEEEPVRDGAYDDLLDAMEGDEGYYLQSSSGRGWLPPRAVDPTSGETELTEQPLPDRGEVETYTVINVATPDFADDAPFALAIVDMGPVKLTGQIRGVDPEDVEIGMAVEPTVVRAETTGERLIGFEPTH
ncbi:MAG: Zn-ribbon domain-containing OB-fold protein [Halodesulfurarchaeum sp.]